MPEAAQTLRATSGRGTGGLKAAQCDAGLKSAPGNNMRRLTACRSCWQRSGPHRIPGRAMTSEASNRDRRQKRRKAQAHVSRRLQGQCSEAVLPSAAEDLPTARQRGRQKRRKAQAHVSRFQRQCSEPLALRAADLPTARQRSTKRQSGSSVIRLRRSISAIVANLKSSAR